MDRYDALLVRISAHAFEGEAEAVSRLLTHCTDYESHWSDIRAEADAMIMRLRECGMGVSVEAFLQEYGLSSKEGVAVMCLAEALLRIPDRDTADALIDATFDGARWEKHIGRSESLFVNASSWGLLLTGKLLQWGDHQTGVSGTLKRLVQNSSEPAIREALKGAMKLIASQFVMGQTVESSLKKAVSFEKKGYCFSYDMLGEGARSMAQADAYMASYVHAIKSVGATRKQEHQLTQAPGVSIKLTALHPRYKWAQKERVMAELLPRLKTLVSFAKEQQICVAIDAEESTRLDIELAVFAALFTDPDFSDFHGIGFVLQAYQKRALHVIDLLVRLCEDTGKTMPVRLVKGAYWDSEIKQAQIDGLPDYPVYTVKAHSDLSYMACAKKLLDQAQHFFPQFATHNALTIASIRAIAGSADYEFQRLYGMGEMLYSSIVGNVPCRIYAPIGEHKDLLAYLIRRLLENGANSSFVHLMMDESKPLDELLANPMIVARRNQGVAGIAPPSALYADRKNSSGYDLGNRAQMQELLTRIAVKEPLATIADASEGQVQEAIAQAYQARKRWNDTAAEERAILLEKTADSLQAHEEEALTLCIQEGKKTIADAIAELREAIDFCRYYARQCRHYFATPLELQGPTGESNQLQLHGRGVFACISPWNFPLAIFTGQIAAALAAGNCVIAKPAEQTPNIAAFAVRLMYEAGIPEDVLHLLCGNGAAIGAALVADEHIAGIAFTGSTETAKSIQRSLADRAGAIVPFIAETGGQNCMLVDSSALLEQVVDDVVHSAFGSAGQRCSALRVLYVHRDIADELIVLLKGAMQELVVGDPSQLCTDIGPVIDAEAKQMLDAHIASMAQEANLIAKGAIKTNAPAADYVVPHAFEIQSISQLRKENFGPILHVIRYGSRELDDVIEAINATGFGLTFGIHSRIPAFAQSVAARIHAGNVYINRGMTGAVVGVQPFGGEGLSGTGPKAGGPYSLLRYASEKTTTINSAAIGGNVELLIR